MRIIKQKGDASGISRQFWESIFTEDTEKFLDYYYSMKAPEAMFYFLMEDGKTVSMLHLNPYRVMWNGGEYHAYYIVAVATKEQYRHRGYMRMLLQEVIKDAHQKQCPFLFLMPADPAIYEPFGFQYVYEHAFYEPADDTVAQAVRTAVLQGSAQTGAFFLRRYTESKAEETAAFAAKELEKRYRTYCIHDACYLNRLARELQSENGDLILVYDRSGSLSGYFCYACEEEEAYQEVILAKGAEKLFSLKERKQMIMAKMTCEENISELKKPCYFPEIV